MGSGVEYSVIVPVYNGSATVGQLLKEITIFFASPPANGKGYSYEVIFVDDASTDTSWQVLTGLKKSNPEIKIIQLEKNCGQHAATLCGAQQATGRYIITIDDDLQHNPADIARLIDEQLKTGAQLTYGYFTNTKPNFGRKLLFTLFKKQVANYAKASSFRLFGRELVKQINTSYKRYFILDAELIRQQPLMAHIGLEKQPRRTGKSGYTLTYLLGFVFSFFLNYTNVPQRVLQTTGQLLALAGFIVAVTSFKNTANIFLLGITLMLVGIALFGLSMLIPVLVRRKNSSVKRLFSIKQSI